jgi:hypothetical protein
MGLYHVVILSVDCQITARHNGRVRYNGRLPASTILFSRPDEEVRSTGHGPIKYLTVSFTPDFLATHLDSLFANPDLIELHDVRATADVGLAHLASTYETIW